MKVHVTKRVGALFLLVLANLLFFKCDLSGRDSNSSINVIDPSNTLASRFTVSSLPLAPPINKTLAQKTTPPTSFEETAAIVKPTVDNLFKHHYEILYNSLFDEVISHAKMRGQRGECHVKMLEIGLGCGMPYGPVGSVALWLTLFGRNDCSLDLRVVEFDAACAEKWLINTFIDVKHYFQAHHHELKDKVDCGWQTNTSSVQLFIGGQQNATLLASIRQDAANHGLYDIVLDDGSHFSSHQRATFTAIFADAMRPLTGIYVIEYLHVQSPKYRYGHWSGRSEKPTLTQTIGEWVTKLAEEDAFGQQQPSSLSPRRIQCRTCAFYK